jgi:hypothetical protein
MHHVSERNGSRSPMRARINSVLLEPSHSSMSHNRASHAQTSASQAYANTSRPGTAGGLLKPHPPQSPSMGSERGSVPGRKAFVSPSEHSSVFEHPHSQSTRPGNTASTHTALSATNNSIGRTSSGIVVSGTGQGAGHPAGQMAEEPVWRTGKTFRCTPGAVRFGFLEFRKLYRMKLTLTNIGVGFAKFRIRQVGNILHVCMCVCVMPVILCACV